MASTSMRYIISRRALRLCLDTPMIHSLKVRCLTLFEYQGKKLLNNNGVNIQKFKIIENVSEANNLEASFRAKRYVIKAQILAGGRVLGHFDNGLKGGVYITNDTVLVAILASRMIGHRLITKETPKEGLLVKKVMVAEAVTIITEKYICFVMDRQSDGPVLIASPAGGKDIEEVANKTPHLIKKVQIDIIEGVPDSLAESVADFLDFKGNVKAKAAVQIKRLWEFFNKVDAVQVEINPLAETWTGDVVAINAKIILDDNAQYRQKEIFDMEDNCESDPREFEAKIYNIKYFGMSGNIGCLVNGAGLAMATMDIINLYGGQPANILDVGGAVKEEQVYQAFKMLSSDKQVKVILVNIFGGIVNCATIAKGIVAAYKDMQLSIPLVVRLEGTNAVEARKILNTSGLPVQSAENLDEAAKRAVSCLA